VSHPRLLSHKFATACFMTHQKGTFNFVFRWNGFLGKVLHPLFWVLYFPYSMSKECFLTGHLQHTWNYIYIALISLIDSLLCLSKVHLVHTQFQGCHITYTGWYKTAIRDLPTVRSLIVILELLTVLLVYINLSIIW